MLVVPGKSRISHHSSPPAFGSVLCSALVSSVLRVPPSVFRVCFASPVSHDLKTHTRLTTDIETVSTRFCLPAGLSSVSPLRSNRTPRAAKNYGSRRRFSASEDYGVTNVPPSIFQYRSLLRDD